MSESIVLDPKEMAPKRAELSLEQLGIRIKGDGADWGESQVAIQLARQQIGSTVTDRHLEPVEMSIPLQVLKEGAVSLADAAIMLQQKVGLWQQDQLDTNWIRRDFSAGGEFAGSVAYIAHSASLQGIQGWFMANRDHAPDVVLKVLRGPLCYATKEIELGVVKEEAARALQFEYANLLGSAPGLIRVRLKNLNAAGATEHWRALLAALESRDHPQDATKSTTAAIVYEAEKLTINTAGGAKEAADANASGGKMVTHETIPPSWITLLSSKVAGVGHMTHIGARRLFVRGSKGASSANPAVELRLQFRVLSANQWTDVGLVVSPGRDYDIFDLGECRPELATIGSQQWEWRIQARSPLGAGKGIVKLDQFYIPSIEQLMVATTPPITLSPDSFASKTGAGTVVGNSTEADGAGGEQAGTIEWVNPTNANASDNAYATVTFGTAWNEWSKALKMTKWGFAIPGGASIVGVGIDVEAKNPSAAGVSVWLYGRFVKGGVYVPGTRMIRGPVSQTDNHLTWGGSEFLPTALTPTDVNAEGFGVLIRAGKLENTLAPVVSVDAVTVTVYYTEVDSNRVCYAQRSLELRSEGVFRQHESEDVWAPIVPEGFNFVAPPSYLEARAVRGLIVASRGDFDTTLDTGAANKYEAQVFYRPAYLFSREAM